MEEAEATSPAAQRPYEGEGAGRESNGSDRLKQSHGAFHPRGRAAPGRAGSRLGLRLGRVCLSNEGTLTRRTQTIPEGLAAFAEGLWLDTAPVSFLGLRLTATMAVIRLGDGGLLVYSPVPLVPERRAAVEALGPVRHLYAPNVYHHTWLGEWAAAFPHARVHAPPDLARKRPLLRLGRDVRLHGDGPEPAFAGHLDEVRIAGCRLGEAVLVHRPSHTLVVADLVHNVGRPAHGWTATYARLMGFHDRVALSRALRWSAFPDRGAARRSLNDLLDRPLERLVVGHGAPLTEGAAEALRDAYAWLRP
jgi:hypothetical protein